MAALASVLVAGTFLVTAILHLLLADAAFARPSKADNLLQRFFDEKLDFDDNGRVDTAEFAEFLRRMDPEDSGDLREDDRRVGILFSKIDTNKDGVVDFDDMSRVLGRLSKYSAGLSKPTQMRLALTNDPSEMLICWVTFYASAAPVMQYSTDPTLATGSHTVAATTVTYDVGNFGGWHGQIHFARSTGLQASQTYYYRVGDSLSGVWSDGVLSFRAAPSLASASTLRIAVVGDHGTAVPLGFQVSEQIEAADKVKPFDMVYHVGDLAYAGVSSGDVGEIEYVWDLWCHQIEPTASHIPYMVTVGNHESYYNFTSYVARFQMPAQPGSVGAFWFSFNFGFVHFLSMSTEHDYSVGSDQYKFMEADLAAARRNKDIRWIIVGGHRPFYSTDTCELSSHIPGCQALTELEPLFARYAVDMVIVGHVHSYERTMPVFQGYVATNSSVPGSDDHQFVDPPHPIYMVQGTAGAMIDESWLEPRPAWSANRQQEYGFGTLTMTNEGFLRYEFFHLEDGGLGDWVEIRKTVH